MSIYNLQPLPDTLPEKLDDLKVLVKGVQDVRLAAEKDVQEGREMMDECDRQLKKLKNKVEGIIGIKPQSKSPKEKKIEPLAP